MKKMLFALYCWLVAVMALPLSAAEISNLYEAEVAVASQSPGDRNAAMAGAMQTVLIKVTGNPGSVRQPAAAELINNASAYVQQYRYRLAEAAAEGEEPRRYVKVLFDAQALNQKLRNAGLPVWGKSRPQIIAWAGIAENRQRRLLNPESDVAVSALLGLQADLRGIPFMLPLMDLEDQSAITTSDLWGAFEAPLRNASSRYLADMILAVVFEQSSNDFWQSTWTLLNRNDQISWKFSGNSIDQVVADGVNKMADLIAAAYAPVGGADLQTLIIQVEEVNSFADLVALQNMLSSLETVSSLDIRQLQDNQVIISLQLRGGQSAFTQAVELTGKLQMLQMEVSSPVVDLPVIKLETPTPVSPVEQTSGASPVELLPQPEPEPVLQPVQIDVFYRLR